MPSGRRLLNRTSENSYFLLEDVITRATLRDLKSGPTARRVAVLGGLLRGDSDKRIMADTGMPMSTTRAHIRALMRLFKVTTRMQLATLFLRKGTPTSALRANDSPEWQQHHVVT